ncbi:MAG: cupin domain-containing protein [Proteobacteria bacterium]|nr:cupin domain-containing protein [Pseudomonadota bacterium]
MALPHAKPLDVIDMRPLGPQLADAKTHSLIKTEKLQLVRIVLPAGHALPEHSLPGEVTVQCLEGEIELLTSTRSHQLQAEQVMLLPAAERHSVRALRDASLLMTVLLAP